MYCTSLDRSVTILVIFYDVKGLWHEEVYNGF